MTTKHLLNGQEVAEQIGISKMLFYKLKREGKFPVEPVVGKYYSKAQVQSWLEAGCPDKERWQSMQEGLI